MESYDPNAPAVAAAWKGFFELWKPVDSSTPPDTKVDEALSVLKRPGGTKGSRLNHLYRLGDRARLAGLHLYRVTRPRRVYLSYKAPVI